MSIQFGSLTVIPKHFPQGHLKTLDKFEIVSRDSETLARPDHESDAWKQYAPSTRHNLENVEKIVERVEANGFDVFIFTGPRTKHSHYYIAFHPRTAEQRLKDSAKRQQEGNIDRGPTDAEALLKAAAEFDARKKQFSETTSADIGRFEPIPLDEIVPKTASSFPYKNSRKVNRTLASNIKDAWEDIGSRRYQYLDLFWPGLEYLEMARHAVHGAADNSPNKKMPSMVAILSQGSSANDLTILETLYEQMCNANPRNKDKITVYYPDDQEDIKRVNAIIEESIRDDFYKSFGEQRARRMARTLIDAMQYSS